MWKVVITLRAGPETGKKKAEEIPERGIKRVFVKKILLYNSITIQGSIVIVIKE